MNYIPKATTLWVVNDELCSCQHQVMLYVNDKK